MESGFTWPFKTPATFTANERAVDALPRDVERLAREEADDRLSTIHLNSTYLDMIDRAYTIRGCGRSALLVLMLPVVLGALSVMMYALVGGYGEVSPPVTIFGIVMSVLLIITVYLAARPIIVHEYFTYTHFPIRFNRKTRMIHVFRHNGPGGVLSVPWDAAYFHVGRGARDQAILDLRGHVMNGDTVVDTFAVGNFFDTEEGIRQIWKFIVVYMEQGPQALPKDIYIVTSTSRSLFNQFLAACHFCNIFVRIPLVYSAFIAVCTPVRWLVMASCKDPVWPPEIQAESVIEPNDPCVWGEPRFSGGTIKDEQAEWDAMVARKRRIKSH